MVPNRRRHARQLVTPPVYVAVDGARNGGVLYDVAEGGLAVDLIDPRITGDPLHLEFDIPETGRHFSALARVTWTSEPGNRVGVRFIDLTQASDLQLKEWIWTKIAATDHSQVGGIPEVEAVPMPDPAPQLQKAAEPIASHWFKPIADEPLPPAPVFRLPSANILRDLAPLVPSTPQAPAAPAPKVKEDAKAPDGVAKNATVATDAPKAKDFSAAKDIAAVQSPAAAEIPAVARDDGSNIIKDLRSTLTQTKTATYAQPRETLSAAPSSLELRRRRRTVLLAALIVVDLILLVVAAAVYSSQDWNAAVMIDDLKSRLTSAFTTSTALPPPRVVPLPSPPEPKAARHTLAPAKPQETPVAPAAAVSVAPAVTSTPTLSQFDVMDTQNSHHLLGHTSTGITVRYERSPETGQSPAASQPEPAGATQTAPPPIADATPNGQVTRHSSGELPTVEVMPDYPALALQENIQGKVVLKATIAKDGTLENVHLVSAPSLLNAAVLNAVKRWRYQPHYQNGEPVEVETEIVVDFSIIAK